MDDRTLEIHYDSGLQDEVKVEFGDDSQLVKGKENMADVIRYWVEEVESGSENQVIFTTNNVAAVYALVEDCYDELIPAAGGVALNSSNEVLVIFRNAKWDLPKGKLEEGESIQQAAVREVQEETGLVDVRLISRLPNTYHTYTIKDKRVLKETYWYLMASNDRALKPQIKEGITEVKWLPKSGLESLFSNTYGNIKIILKEIMG